MSCEHVRYLADGRPDPVPDLAGAIRDLAIWTLMSPDLQELHTRFGTVLARIRELGVREPDPEGAGRGRVLREVRWAPYAEFGIPDPAAETFEPPSGPVIICATGYRDADIIIYWEAEAR